MNRKTVMLFGILLFLGGLQAKDFKDLTPRQAFDLSREQNTFLVDVRSVAEYTFVGHPEMAYNVPSAFWNEEAQTMVGNDEFIADLEARFKKSDTLIFICRSGGRSRRAAQTAYEAGFQKVNNVVEGFEGGTDERGYRTKGGWKNSLPYTYKIDPELKYDPER